MKVLSKAVAVFSVCQQIKCFIRPGEGKQEVIKVATMAETIMKLYQQTLKCLLLSSWVVSG